MQKFEHLDVLDTNGREELSVRLGIGALEDVLEQNRVAHYIRKLIEDHNQDPSRSDIPKYVDPYLINQLLEKLMPTTELIEASKGCLSWPTTPNTDIMKKAS
jgi:hypothetical protein